MLSLNTVQTYYFPSSQPKIWRKIPKIGGVSTLETLTFRMYDWTVMFMFMIVVSAYYTYLQQYLKSHMTLICLVKQVYAGAGRLTQP